MQSSTELPNRSSAARWLRLARLAALLLAITAGGAFALERLEAVGGPAGLRQRTGPLTAIVLVPLHAVVAVSPLPAEALAVGNGLVFGFWGGSLCSWIGWMLAAVLQYWLFRGAAAELAVKRPPRWLARFPVGHPAFLILVRWIPCGGHIVNVSAGATGVPLARHLWCAAIALVPVSMLFAAIASGLVRMNG